MVRKHLFIMWGIIIALFLVVFLSTLIGLLMESKSMLVVSLAASVGVALILLHSLYFLFIPELMFKMYLMVLMMKELIKETFKSGSTKYSNLLFKGTHSTKAPGETSYTTKETVETFTHKTFWLVLFCILSIVLILIFMPPVDFVPNGLWFLIKIFLLLFFIILFVWALSRLSSSSKSTTTANTQKIQKDQDNLKQKLLE